MSDRSRRLAGILLLVFPTVVFGGVSILRLLIDDPAYRANPLRQDLWRAGHAHAGVLVLFSLVAMLYVDQAGLSDGLKALTRTLIVAAPILMPLGFFLSVAPPRSERPNRMILSTYAGAVILVAAVLTLGVSLI